MSSITYTEYFEEDIKFTKNGEMYVESAVPPFWSHGRSVRHILVPACECPPKAECPITRAEALWSLICDEILDIPNGSYLQVKDDEAVKILERFLKTGR